LKCNSKIFLHTIMFSTKNISNACLDYFGLKLKNTFLPINVFAQIEKRLFSSQSIDYRFCPNFGQNLNRIWRLILEIWAKSYFWISIQNNQIFKIFFIENMIVYKKYFWIKFQTTIIFNRKVDRFRKIFVKNINYYSINFSV
jgi:hypothetical protein